MEISFVGTAFHGWQIQENATTIQGVLNEGISKILSVTQLTTVGCGRTDTGVHAQSFFLHFDVELPIEKQSLVFRLNQILPNSIAVARLWEVNNEAHARFDALGREYVYHLHQRKDPFLYGKSYFYPHALDLKALNAIEEIMLEQKDFSAFSKSNTQVKTNNCKVQKAHWEKNGGQIQFTIVADRFLRNMVRAVVGTALQVGSGKMSIAEFKGVLERGKRSEAGESVPACGLYLNRVIYPDELMGGKKDG